ncbi:MAG TPA: histidine kinase dimerization/phospho-acceptor domain-containing protein [Anaeromyxobacter sp.]
MSWNIPWRGRARVDALSRIVAEWRDTLDAIEWPILALDLDGRIARMNRAAQRLAGLAFDALLGRPVGALGSWQPWREISQMARAVVETRTGLSRQVAGDRAKAWHVSASFSAGTSAAGARIIVVARDVTAVTQLEAQLRRSETMAAMGTLVSGVAHEVRNPLFAISATVDALDARFGGREDLGAFVATLRGEVDRLGRLMRDLLDYGKPQALDLSWVDSREPRRRPPPGSRRTLELAGERPPIGHVAVESRP